ncbi:MAG: hypothetical protein WED00_03350 [Aquisalimonadaceae bacterium]
MTPLQFPRLCGLLFCLLIAGDLAADWHDPQPFRRDRLDGRQFEYNAESFLHRFSFEAKPALGYSRRVSREGLRGTAGSTRSSELYVNMEARARFDMDGPAFAEYRFRRFEDFDGRYDSNLIGVGAEYGDWRATLRGDVVGAKEDIDLQYELRWGNGAGSHIRAVLVQVDAMYNSKQGEGGYERYPFTGYLEGVWLAPGNVAVYGFINSNRPTRLSEAERDFRLRDEQHAVGVGMDVPMGRNWAVGLELEGLYGVRRRDGYAAPGMNDQRLRRRFGAGTLELRQTVRQDLSAWYGVRYLRLVEDDRRPGDPDAWNRASRRETMIYGGVRWQWRERVALSPGVFLNHVDNRERFPFAADQNDRERGFYGKLAPAVELLVNRRTGGTISINPTVRLHRLAFGGGNIQADFPF